jgi:5'-nucleotidase
MRRLALLTLYYLCAAAPAKDVPDTVHVIHVNDVHSHLDEFNSYGNDCQLSSLTKPHLAESEQRTAQACSGGYARIKAQVDTLRDTYPNNHLVLNAGDEFQGTMFYTYYKGQKTAEVLNRMHFDAVTLGNHEFDDGPEHLAAYLQNLTAPIVCANVETSIDALRDALVPSLEFPKLGIAVLGLLTPETKAVSSPGDEVTFVEPLEMVQALIDELRNRGYKRIIALTHIGYRQDQELVKATKGLSLVVGGHSHTFLGDVPGSEGPYPTIVKDLDDVEVPIVTNGKWGFNLGHLEVTFAKDGRVTAYAGQPIRLLPDTSFDKKLEHDIRAWKQPFLDYAMQVVGYARKPFSQMTCQLTECSIGNLVADAMLDAHPRGHAAMVNAGGLRAGLAHGNITRGEVMSILPFGSTLVDLVLTGAELWETIEGIVSWQNQQTGHETTSFAQVSGMQIVYSSTRPKGERLASLKVRKHDVTEKTDSAWQDVDKTASYTIVTLDFMVAGGDYWWSERSDFVRQEKVDEVLVSFVQKQKAVLPVLDGRIKDTSIKGIVKNFAEPLIHFGHDLFELWYDFFSCVALELTLTDTLGFLLLAAFLNMASKRFELAPRLPLTGSMNRRT